MFKLLFVMTTVVLLTLAGRSQASTVAPAFRVERVLLGSGIQGALGSDVAEQVGDYGVWHVPQYMPGYPTAATIWPRVVETQCIDGLCKGFVITPELGRGEYLYFRPLGK